MEMDSLGRLDFGSLSAMPPAVVALGVAVFILSIVYTLV